MAERLRIAHVGCGTWGANLVREVAGHPFASLELVIDRDPDARDRARRIAPGVATARSVDALGSGRFDAVLIASPGPQHAEHALAALAAGAHVFVEKPMTTSVEQARTLVASCRAHNRIGMVGHLLHHHAGVRSLLRLVRDGRIGTPRVFHSARYCKRGSRDADGSLLWSLAPHDMSVLRGLDDGPVRSMRVALSAERSGGVPNLAELRIRLAGGIDARVVVSRAHHDKVRRMEVVGDEGSIVFDDLGERKLVLRRGAKTDVIGYDDAVTPLAAEVDAFLTCVREGKPPQMGFEEGLQVVQLIERAHAVASFTSESPLLSAVR